MLEFVGVRTFFGWNDGRDDLCTGGTIIVPARVANGRFVGRRDDVGRSFPATFGLPRDVLEPGALAARGAPVGDVQHELAVRGEQPTPLPV